MCRYPPPAFTHVLFDAAAAVGFVRQVHGGDYDDDDGAAADDDDDDDDDNDGDDDTDKISPFFILFTADAP